MSQPLSEPLRQLLAEIPRRVEPETVDRLWIFAPRETAAGERGLVVLSLRDTAGMEPDQRQVVTWRYEAVRERSGFRRTDSLEAQGRAPADRIERLIEGVLRRLGDADETPIAHEVAGDPARLSEVLAGVGAAGS